MDNAYLSIAIDDSNAMFILLQLFYGLEEVGSNLSQPINFFVKLKLIGTTPYVSL